WSFGAASWKRNTVSALHRTSCCLILPPKGRASTNVSRRRRRKKRHKLSVMTGLVLPAGHSTQLRYASAPPLLVSLARHPPKRLGTRAGVAVYGSLLRDDPCTVTSLSRHRARRIYAHCRFHRRYRGGHRLDHEDFLRCAERLSRQAPAPGGARLWPCRFHQANLSAGFEHRMADSGAFR